MIPPSLRGSRGAYITESPAQAYYVPRLDLVIKVEKRNTNQYTAHFFEGSEVVSLDDMKAEKWKCLGPWERKHDKLH